MSQKYGPRRQLSGHRGIPGQAKPLIMEKCQLKLHIERNLDKSFILLPDQKGPAVPVHAVVDINQYKLSANWGSRWSKLRGRGRPTCWERLPAGGHDGEAWTTTFMHIEQHRVTVDLVDQHMLPHLAR